MKEISVITVFEIDDGVLLAFQTDFQGGNNFYYVADNIKGFKSLKSL